ncbi:hypothetical protein K439DRAFT_622221 [Ramaria rubella]|nr:hypothetical protein K439DRAFT_622221 [Ramaria rubella]
MNLPSSLQPEAPPVIPLDVEPFTADFIPLPNSPSNKHDPPKHRAVSLSQEQQHILYLVQQGKNIFFTGSAGRNLISFHLNIQKIDSDSRHWKVDPVEGDNK